MVRRRRPEEERSHDALRRHVYLIHRATGSRLGRLQQRALAHERIEPPGTPSSKRSPPAGRPVARWRSGTSRAEQAGFPVAGVFIFIGHARAPSCCEVLGAGRAATLTELWMETEAGSLRRRRGARRLRRQLATAPARRDAAVRAEPLPERTSTEAGPRALPRRLRPPAWLIPLTARADSGRQPGIPVRRRRRLLMRMVRGLWRPQRPLQLVLVGVVRCRPSPARRTTTRGTTTAAALSGAVSIDGSSTAFRSPRPCRGVGKLHRDVRVTWALRHRRRLPRSSAPGRPTSPTPRGRSRLRPERCAATGIDFIDSRRLEGCRGGEPRRRLADRHHA